MEWSRAARLPQTSGGLGLPLGAPYTAGRLVRSAAAIFGLLGVAWLVAALPLRWSAAAVAAGGAALLLLRFPYLIWPGLAVVLPFASGYKIGPLSLADGILGTASPFVVCRRRAKGQTSP